MSFHLAIAAALLDDGGLAGVFQSPFIVPVAGILMVLGIVVASIWAGVRSQEMRSQERLAAIAKGLPLEPTLAESVLRNATTPASSVAGPFSRTNNGAGARRAGLILLSTGVGLIAFFFALAAIVQVKEVLSGAAVGLIPGIIGIGFLIDARLRRVEFDRAMEELSSRAPLSGTQLGPLH